MKILHVTPSFFPATYWGGPIWSTKAICDGIAATRGFELSVLSTDSAGPRLRDRVVPAQLPYRVHYARRIAGASLAPGLLAGLPGAIARADLVHLTGTYSAPTLPTLFWARAIGRPLVWSPRGALQATAQWADAPRRLSKTGFEQLAQRLRPPRTVLHVTAQAEAEASLTRLPGIATAVIPNSVSLPELPAVWPRQDNTCRLVYLGRLHPKKGLDLLLAAMARLPPHFTLDIYGSGARAYRDALAAKVVGFGGRVRLRGAVHGAEKTRALAGADLFVLPSHSENFGIAIAEALAHATPVLTTTATPWQSVERHGCGRCIDLGRSDLAREIADMAATDLQAQGQRGRAWMARDFSHQAMVDRFAALYRELTPARLAATAAVRA